ncbi:MAG: class II fructose-bisphosphate aldolase [Candidatus Humimicrobiaceae bacterium]
MPLINLRSLIEESEANKYALAGFNILNLEMIEGVLEAAEKLGLRVVLNVHPDQIIHTSLEVIAATVKETAGRVKVPVVLHLDYAADLSILREAINCGFTSLMYVAPAELSFEEVIRETRNAVELSHSNELLVESEFKPEGNGGLTDPVQAERFIRETDVDVLSPQIGTSHGGGKADLDLGLLKEIKEKAKCFISLHGGSGVEDGIIQKAIGLGINKASVYSLISKAAIGRINERLSSKDMPDMVEASGIIKEAIKKTAMNRLSVLSMKKFNAAKNPSSPSDDRPGNNIDNLVKDVIRQVLHKLGKN